MAFDIIEFIKYIVIGLVQGITEVLPVSSSGHVELMSNLVGLTKDENVFFLILLNTGSLATFLIIYFKKLVELAKSFFIYIFNKEKREENKNNVIFLLKVLIACIPAGLFGILIKPLIENIMVDYSILLAGIGLLITATVLLLVSRLNFRKEETEISWLDTVFIGFAQAIAVFPGVSRSGMTTSMALKKGKSIDQALNFSFLMYIFISIASTLLLVFDLTSESSNIASVQYLYYVFAFLAAMGATFIAYKLIFNIFKSGKIKYFSFYCFIVGILALILFAF